MLLIMYTPHTLIKCIYTCSMTNKKNAFPRKAIWCNMQQINTQKTNSTAAVLNVYQNDYLLEAFVPKGKKQP